MMVFWSFFIPFAVSVFFDRSGGATLPRLSFSAVIRSLARSSNSLFLFRTYIPCFAVRVSLAFKVVFMLYVA